MCKTIIIIINVFPLVAYYDAIMAYGFYTLIDKSLIKRKNIVTTLFIINS